MVNPNDTTAGPASRQDWLTPNDNPTAGTPGDAPGDAPPQRFTEIGAKRFLDELAETGSVCEAARRARMPRASLYRRRADDAGFAKAWDQALEMAYNLLHDEAMRRALHGVEKPVFHRGAQVATVRQKSDRLLMFLMRAHRPDRYDPRYMAPHRHTRRDPAAIEKERATRARATAILERWRESQRQEALARQQEDAPRPAPRRGKGKGGGRGKAPPK